MSDRGSPELPPPPFLMFFPPVWMWTAFQQIHSVLKMAVSRVTCPQTMLQRCEEGAEGSQFWRAPGVWSRGWRHKELGSALAQVMCLSHRFQGSHLDAISPVCPWPCVREAGCKRDRDPISQTLYFGAKHLAWIILLYFPLTHKNSVSC